MSSEQKPYIEHFVSDFSKGRPFSDAVRAGDMLYLSGRLAIDGSGKVIPGGIAKETRQIMDDIKETLKKYGSSLDKVVKVTVMLADMNEWAEMNKVYVKYFSDKLPARSAFGASGLALGARVEIECIASMK